jgi:cytochrome c556
MALWNLWGWAGYVGRNWRMFAFAMRRHITIQVLLAAAVVLGACAKPVDPDPIQGPGWTGVSRPGELITARLELMVHVEELMKPLDTLTVEAVEDAPQLHTNAEVISVMLLTLPHLFPPTTNLYDPRSRDPATLAQPAIWKNFDNFFRLAMAASQAAEAVARAQGMEQLRSTSLQLRASCDACHELYLRRYVPPKVQASDYEFDFDSALPRP